MWTPQLAPNAYNTYAIRTPSRPATCAEIECDAWKHGWVTRVPAASEAALYLGSGMSGRTYVETAAERSTDREFRFHSGQTCFAAGEHRIAVGDDALFLKTHGLRGQGRALGAEQWLDDFGRNQEALKKNIEG